MIGTAVICEKFVARDKVTDFIEIPLKFSIRIMCYKKWTMYRFLKHAEYIHVYIWATCIVITMISVLWLRITVSNKRCRWCWFESDELWRLQPRQQPHDGSCICEGEKEMLLLLLLLLPSLFLLLLGRWCNTLRAPTRPQRMGEITVTEAVSAFTSVFVVSWCEVGICWLKRHRRRRRRCSGDHLCCCCCRRRSGRNVWMPRSVTFQHGQGQWQTILFV